jgi:hypothetical protein
MPESGQWKHQAVLSEPTLKCSYFLDIDKINRERKI